MPKKIPRCAPPSYVCDFIFCIFSLQSNTLLHTYSKETDILAVGFSSQDDNFIVSVSESKTYEVWSVSKIILKTSRSRVVFRTLTNI